MEQQEFVILSEDEAREQRVAYAALLNRLGQATPEQVQAALAAREETEPKPKLSPEVAERVRKRIAPAGR